MHQSFTPVVTNLLQLILLHYVWIEGICVLGKEREVFEGMYFSLFGITISDEKDLEGKGLKGFSSLILLMDKSLQK